MAFEVLQARTPDEPADPLYPIPAPDGLSYLTEPGDGSVIVLDVRAATSSVAGNGGERAQVETARVTDVKAKVVITESRVIFLCKQFRSGTHMRGYGGAAAPLLAMTVNAATKAAANRKVRDYVLVGHVQYDWLAGGSAQNHKWRVSPNAFRLVFRDPSRQARTATLTIYPERTHPAIDAATEIMRRAARWKALSAEKPLQETLSRWSETAPSKEQNTGHGRAWIIPTRAEG